MLIGNPLHDIVPESCFEDAGNIVNVYSSDRVKKKLRIYLILHSMAQMVIRVMWQIVFMMLDRP